MSDPQPTSRAVVAQAGRLDLALVEHHPSLSRTRVASLIREGAVRVNDRVVFKVGLRVEPGDRLALDLPAPSPSASHAQPIPLRIVYQDTDLAVIDKAPGMVVHPGAGHPDGTLVNALLHHLDDLSGIGGVERPGIVHRLDKGTSGLLVVAKNDRAHRALAGQFAEHSARRRYLALVHGVPSSSGGTIRSSIGRDPRDRTRFCTVDDDAGRLAITHWRRLGGAEGLGLVECRLQTGRTHQIRVHLSESGHPLVGDPTYRRAGMHVPDVIRERVDALDQRPLLHAWSLSIDHPSTGERMGWRAPVPQDYVQILGGLALLDRLPRALGQGQVLSVR